MKYLIILQARTSSIRLPGKVLEIVNGRTLIEWQIARLKQSNVKNIILATSDSSSDDYLSQIVLNDGIQVFRGSLNDVHSRFKTIIEELNPENFIRITGDNPLFMPQLLNEMISRFEELHCDYLSNVNPPTFPDGLDIEIVSTLAFKKYSMGDLTNEEKEHVTLGMYANQSEFYVANFSSDEDFSDYRWTVDYPEDLQFVRSVFEHFCGNETLFQLGDLLALVSSGVIQQNSKRSSFRNIALRSELDSEPISKIN